MIDDAEAADEREPERAGEAERVEERQHAEHARRRSVTWNTCRIASTFARMLRCVSITPFGSPVLPLEKMTVASASARARRPA